MHITDGLITNLRALVDKLYVYDGVMWCGVNVIEFCHAFHCSADWADTIHFAKLLAYFR